jgi:hypothetical protein
MASKLKWVTVDLETDKRVYNSSVLLLSIDFLIRKTVMIQFVFHSVANQKLTGLEATQDREMIMILNSIIIKSILLPATMDLNQMQLTKSVKLTQVKLSNVTNQKIIKLNFLISLDKNCKTSQLHHL